MADKLYRSHSLEISNEGKSGSLTLWEDAPVSPFNIGDTFYPVGSSLPLTVDKVSIRDNVIGEQFGKTLRQWEITIEGSNSSAQEQSTHVRYNFNISSGEKSGTMEVTNTGDAPAISLDIGDNFNVPGIGSVTCVKVSGNDSYNDDNIHTWTVTYEGSDHPDASSQDDDLPDTKYTLAIQKDNDGDIQKSGSMFVVNEGEAPVFDVSIGSKFSIPGIGEITCTKVSANDDYTDAGTHRWSVTYEGLIAGASGGDDEQPDDSNSNAKFSFALEHDSRSGSVEITSAGNDPVFAHNVGDKITLPGVGEVTCSKVSGSDSYSDNGKRKWTVVYECSDNVQIDDDSQEGNVKYTLNIENNSDGVTVYSGSKEISCSGSAPTVSVNIGDTFTLPLVGSLTCTKIHSSNSDANSWSVIVEGSRTGGSSGSGDDEGDDEALPDNEVSVTYEINGSTVRSVSGEFIALRKSETPITKKSFTVYSDSDTPAALPGETYGGGIVTSVNIIRETIKSNGVVTGSYYKHSVEVEA